MDSRFDPLILKYENSWQMNEWMSKSEQSLRHWDPLWNERQVRLLSFSSKICDFIFLSPIDLLLRQDLGQVQNDQNDTETLDGQ